MKKEMLEPTLKPKAKKKLTPKFIPSFKKLNSDSTPFPKRSFMPPKPSFTPAELRIMDKQHPRWTNFLELVNVLLGYNGPCSGDLKFVKYVLVGEHVDIEKSVKYLQDNGGYCDCEILMNVV